MNKKFLMLAIGLLVVLVVTCAPRAGTVKLVTPTPVPLILDYDAGTEKTLESPQGIGGGGLSAGRQASEERMIVRTAELSLVVKDAEISVSQIKGIVNALGGYVVETRLWREEEQLRGWVTVRVPSTSLDDALGRFKTLAVRVERESGSSQDVTEEYTDLDAQLRNLEATEEELRELLRTVREKTGKAEDILAVHRELVNIRGQIEQLKGRMQYLERTSAMAAVTIELVPERPITGSWPLLETVTDALRALLQALRFIATVAIWVVLCVLPVALVLLLPFVIAWLVWRHRRKEKTATPHARGQS